MPDLSEPGKHIYSLIREIDRFNELSHSFDPIVLSEALKESPSSWLAKNDHAESQIASAIRVIDETIALATGASRNVARRKPSGGSYFSAITDGVPSEHTVYELAASMLLGCAFGRWDIRHTLGVKKERELSDPFAALGACSPPMLQGADGLPLTIAPNRYPLCVSAHGILVDDAQHPDDIISRAREVLEQICKQRADAVEKEICKALDVKELRDYFRKFSKGGFWDDHVSRYSKSRRKAPIYWLLQSSKKNYAIWLYYHRLDKDLLFKALVNFIEPKIRLETSRFETLRIQKAAAGDSGKEAKRLAKELERQEDFVSELRDFEDKLRRAANLNLEPDLNDGVVLNIAPLWELVPWKEAKNYWDELLKGAYEWSTIGKQLRQKGLVK